MSTIIKSGFDVFLKDAGLFDNKLIGDGYCMLCAGTVSVGFKVGEVLNSSKIQTALDEFYKNIITAANLATYSKTDEFLDFVSKRRKLWPASPEHWV